MCRKIATVLALSVLLSQAVVAQESLDSFPVLGPELPQTILDTPEFPNDLNVLTRGPLHEAFASAHQANPQPTEPVYKTPPQPVDEVPPEYRPEGNNVQWIPGYWAWDDSQSDFIWISGIWRDVPPNRAWIPGYWIDESGGYRWVSGFWAEESQQQLGYLPEPPASIDQGPSSAAPGEDYFYVPGNWEHQQGNYRWYAGHWQPVVENWIWIPSRYIWTPNGCVYQSGYWDYEFQSRGTCFAPVHFTQPVYLANNYRYRPSYAINLNVDFLAHLFVRPKYGHYFYGDWYASNFTSIGYRPWVSYTSHYRSYDPLLTYYHSRRSSFDNRYNVVQHLTRQHNFYVNNRDYRPRPTYKSQYKHSQKVKNINALGPRNANQDYLRKSNYVRSYKVSNSKKYRAVAEQELRNNRRNAEQFAKLQRDRKRQELSVQNRNRQAQSQVAGQQNNRDAAARRLAQQLDEARRIQARSMRNREQAQRDQRAERTQQDLARRLNQQNLQRDIARRTQQDLDRRTRQLADNGANQDRARRAQQDQARRTAQQQSQRDATRRAQQDQARRAQRDADNRANQDRARRAQQDQARRTAQQQSQRDATRRAQQDQARRAKQAADNLSLIHI